MKKLVRLWKRSTFNGKKYTYYLVYYDTDGRRKQKALGHADKRKAEKQRAQLTRELRMDTVDSGSMRLSNFLQDSLDRSRGQVRENTALEYSSAMRQFIEVVGNIDYRCVRHEQGERFIQKCLDGGNRPATVAKKIGALKRLFQLAVERGQLEDNPFRYVRKPKTAQRAIHTFSNDECARMVKTARQVHIGSPFRWDIFILTALCTGMRRGELLNTTWQDIDFAGRKVRVSPKHDSECTWVWRIKDTDIRSVPLTNDVIDLLREHRLEYAEGNPYVFIPAYRYAHIQNLRKEGQWSERRGLCPASNFRYQFRVIMTKAGIEKGEFHDLRRTCLTNWLANGLNEHDVMTMAGHASFETTRRFYLAVRRDLLDRARKASSAALKFISVEKLLQIKKERKIKKD
jgi:integrase